MHGLNISHICLFQCWMAGLSALGGHKEGRWYVCDDGWPLEPLDALHLLFPNIGRSKEGNLSGVIPCFVPQKFQFASLLNLLPEETNVFVPSDFVDSIVVLGLLCVLVTIGMVVSRFVWNAIDPSFAAVSPTHKQWYVVANMSKVLFLACMCLSSRFWIYLYSAYIKDEFTRVETKRSTILYCVTDVVALYMVPKLPTSTILHHIIAPTLILAVSTVNLSIAGWGGVVGVAKIGILYGCCSTFPFTVNAYLALRVVYPKAQWLQTLAKVALGTYLVCCAVNWTIHLLWVFGVLWSLDISVWTMLYVFLASFMVHDDIILIKWLLKRSSPMADDNHKAVKQD